MKDVKEFFVVLLACLIFGNILGCSALMAAKQPNKKDEALLIKGTSRARVVAEFGAPVISELKNGQRIDVYAFKQGYSKTNKISRAVWHSAADIASLGLWEVIGTPAETAYSGTDVAYQVIYDQDDLIVDILQLKK